MRYGWLLLLLLVGCVGTAAESTPVASDEIAGQLVVAWELDRHLFVWQTDSPEAHQLVTGDVVQAFIAPDGETIAFTRGANRAPESLWFVRFDGTEAQQLVASQTATQIGDVVWLDEDTLYFNTLSQSEPAYIPNDDLYRAETRSGEVVPVLSAGDGGRIHISPDRQHIVLTHPGRYADTEARISVYDPVSGGSPRTLLNFPAVASASEYAFAPEIFWEPDSSAARVAIPDADAVYSEYSAEDAPPVQLWRLPIDAANAAENIGEVQASFFGLPRWSDDGTQMLYYQTHSTRLDLMIAAGDGANAQVLIQNANLTLGDFPQWLPDSLTFSYPELGDDGAFRYFVASRTSEASRLSDEGVVLPHYLTSEQYLGWFAGSNGTAELRFAEISGSIITLATFSDVVFAWDAIWLEGE